MPHRSSGDMLTIHFESTNRRCPASHRELDFDGRQGMPLRFLLARSVNRSQRGSDFAVKCASGNIPHRKASPAMSANKADLASVHATCLQVQQLLADAFYQITCIGVESLDRGSTNAKYDGVNVLFWNTLPHRGAESKHSQKPPKQG